jgi:hypothetical protein
MPETTLLQLGAPPAALGGTRRTGNTQAIRRYHR